MKAAMFETMTKALTSELNDRLGWRVYDLVMCGYSYSRIAVIFDEIESAWHAKRLFERVHQPCR